MRSDMIPADRREVVADAVGGCPYCRGALTLDNAVHGRLACRICLGTGDAAAYEGDLGYEARPRELRRIAELLMAQGIPAGEMSETGPDERRANPQMAALHDLHDRLCGCDSPGQVGLCSHEEFAALATRTEAV